VGGAIGVRSLQSIEWLLTPPHRVAPLRPERVASSQANRQ